MIAEFHDSGVCFKYPENWALEREDSDDGWTVTVQSPDTAFLLVSLHRDMPSPEDMADTALAALQEDYPDIEADGRIESILGQPAVGHDIQFFSLDLINSCWIRSFYTPQGTLLLMRQFNDLELEKNEPVLRAICASMKIEEE